MPNSKQKSKHLSKHLIVQKYGGATLSDPQKIKSVARRIATLSKTGTQVVAVVSAMGKTTNQLIELALQVSQNPRRRELDMLLTTGERISMSLVSLALIDAGCEAISFTGSQAGIFTDDSHVNAFIVDVKAFRVQESLAQGKVVVLAGFQGVSPVTKEITTLGRGGTDTTAVAMAAFLKADRCEILKDVDGVYTANPDIVPMARPIQKLNYDQLSEMTFWGAKVLHYRSVELAKKNKVSLYVGPAASEKAGTLINEGEKMFESHSLLAVNSHEKVLALNVLSDSPAQALQCIQVEFEKKQIAFPQLLHLQSHSDHSKIFLTGPSETISSIQRDFARHEKIKIEAEIFSSVSATCTGSTAPEVPKKILSQLDAAHITVKELILSSMTVTVFVLQKDHNKAVQELHSLI